MKQLRYLNKFFFKYKWHFIFGLLFIAISNLFGVLPPVVIRHAFNLVKQNITYYQMYEGFELQSHFYNVFTYSLLFFAGIVLVLALLKGLFMFFMRQTIIVMSRHIEYDLRNEMYAHYQQLDQGFYRKNATGDLMSRVSEDVNRVRMYLGPAIMYAMNTAVLFTMVIGVMVSVNPTLTAYVLIPLPILSVSIYYVSNVINKRSSAIQEQLSTLTSTAQEVFSGIRVVKSYVQEKTYGKFFAQQSKNYKEKSLSLARIEALFFPLMLLLIGLSTIITVYIGGSQVIAGKITPGNIVEFVIYVTMLTWPVTSLGWIASIVQRAAASQQRINEFMQTEPTVKPNTLGTKAESGELAFQNVSFTYPDTGVKALTNVNFSLKEGERMAIVGRTGSGKTTIADLICRMYDPTKGAITLNEQPLNALETKSLRDLIGYVPQDVFLFSENIYNNIGFGADNVDQADAEKMAAFASIHKEISALQEGYETFVGERGVTLSGGQKQRLSIARAFMKEPKLLVLDDCLSAVDTTTEKTILDSLDILLRNKTAIIITHRIFSLLQFDKILVLDNGQVAETGTHQSLLELDGIYAEMYRKQQEEAATEGV